MLWKSKMACDKGERIRRFTAYTSFSQHGTKLLLPTKLHFGSDRLVETQHQPGALIRPIPPPSSVLSSN